MKKRKLLLIACFSLVAAMFCGSMQAGTGTPAGKPSPKQKVYRVGIFAPLYLDLAFTPTGEFKYTQGIPRTMMPGLDFIQGAEAALDSMDLGDVSIIATFFDAKSTTTPIPLLIKNKKLDSLDIIIGAVKDDEYRQLANFAFIKKIPFISATYPNDGGITENPFVTIVTPTLKTHCEAIFSYLVQNHGTDKIILLKRKGIQEDRVISYLKDANNKDGKPLLNMETASVDSLVKYDFLRKLLDTGHNIIVGASLELHFATSLARTCNDLHTQYAITLIGMPNWNDMNREGLGDFPVYYTTPDFYEALDDDSSSYAKLLENNYATLYKTDAPDMAYKGFECAYTFTKAVIEHPKDFATHLNDSEYNVFSTYNFLPVYLKTESSMPDYYENKHLYFIKIQGDQEEKAW